MLSIFHLPLDIIYGILLWLKICKDKMLLFAGRTSFISSYSRNDMNRTDKCVVLILHPRQAKDNNVQCQLNGESLRSVSPHRGLGVIVDEALKPHRQCAKAAKSAGSIMRAIKASFMNITPKLFYKLYGTFIRPQL